jgi:hypothetical protein
MGRIFCPRQNIFSNFFLFIMIKCDLHGLTLKEAKDIIRDKIQECWEKGNPLLHLIHGYHGHVIKDYVESEEFLADMNEAGFPLERIIRQKKRTFNPGENFFRLSLLGFTYSD